MIYGYGYVFFTYDLMVPCISYLPCGMKELTLRYYYLPCGTLCHLAVPCATLRYIAVFSMTICRSKPSTA